MPDLSKPFILSLVADSRPSSTEPNSMDNSSSLRRACSLSDLNRPAVTKRLLPAPPTVGNAYFQSRNLIIVQFLLQFSL